MAQREGSREPRERDSKKDVAKKTLAARFRSGHAWACAMAPVRCRPSLLVAAQDGCCEQILNSPPLLTPPSPPLLTSPLPVSVLAFVLRTPLPSPPDLPPLCPLPFPSLPSPLDLSRNWFVRPKRFAHFPKGNTRTQFFGAFRGPVRAKKTLARHFGACGESPPLTPALNVGEGGVASPRCCKKNARNFWRAPRNFSRFSTLNTGGQGETPKHYFSARAFFLHAPGSKNMFLKTKTQHASDLAEER